MNAGQWAAVAAAAAAFLTAAAAWLKGRQAHRKIGSHAAWHDQQPAAPAPVASPNPPAPAVSESDVAAFDAAVAGIEAADRGSIGPLGEPLPGPVTPPPAATSNVPAAALEVPGELPTSVAPSAPSADPQPAPVPPRKPRQPRRAGGTAAP